MGLFFRSLATAAAGANFTAEKPSWICYFAGVVVSPKFAQGALAQERDARQAEMWGKLMSKLCPPIALALGLFAAALPPPALAQATGSESPQQNVRSSQQYEQLLCTNKAFQAKRIAQECGPLQGSPFYDNCVASFDCKRSATDSQFRQAPPSETIR